MPDALSPESLVEVANRTYDVLPAITSSFLAHAAAVGLSFDRAEFVEGLSPQAFGNPVKVEKW